MSLNINFINNIILKNTKKLINLRSACDQNANKVIHLLWQVTISVTCFIFTHNTTLMLYFGA